LNGVIKAMTETLVHRGPEKEGYYLEPSLALGHRRLRIIDLVTGDQPMVSQSERFVISYNGEIYNYRELRHALESSGARFRTESDTEVLLELLAREGLTAIKRCLGMFALALWDRQKHSLTLIRDRLGVKPLWYTTLADGSLFFGSEIKALLKAPGVVRRLNRPALIDYLFYRQPGRTQSLFENIRQVAPGTALTWQAGRLEEYRYWQLEPKSQDQCSASEAVSLVREEVTAAVRRRLIADVPLGAYLSGGLDSSVVVATMAKHATAPVKTFAIGFPEDGFNEFKWARLVADRYATDHHEIDIDVSDYQGLWREMICLRDAPLAVPNEVALLRMSKELKRSITVVLSGEGADELFGGYGRIFRSGDDFTRLRALNVEQNLFSADSRELFLGPLLKRYGRTDFASDGEFFLQRYRWFPDELAARILRDRDTPSALTEEMLEGLHYASRLDIPSRFLYLFQLWHLHGLLMRLDATTMAAAVEARVPFVDHTLIETVFPLAFDLKCRFRSTGSALAAATRAADDVSEILDTTKWMLREAFKTDLPDEVLSRKKVGFPVPLASWLDRGLADFAREATTQMAVRQQAVFDEKVVDAFIASARTQDDALKVWMIANVALFLSEYFP
jgi:asparagine synthase (glutamine-hydrolysing)